MVCGARPFERGDETDRRPAAHRIRRDPPIPLHRRAPEVPLALERIIMHGTHGLWGSFAGFELCIGLRKHKHLLPGCQTHMRALSS